MFEEEFKLINENRFKEQSETITNLDFIEHYKDYLDWEILSSREDLMKNYEFLERFKDKIKWWDNYRHVLWNIFWKYRDYSLKLEISDLEKKYHCALDYFINSNKDRKYEILECLLQYPEYSEIVSRHLDFPENSTDIDFIRKHQNKLNWKFIFYSIIYKVEDYDALLNILSEFKDKIYWNKFMNRPLFISDVKLFDWIYNNVSDKIDWDHFLISKTSFELSIIPIQCMKLIRLKIKDSTIKNYCYKDDIFNICDSLLYLKEEIVTSEYINWKEVSSLLLSPYCKDRRGNYIKKYFSSEFIEKYKSYIQWDIVNDKLCYLFKSITKDNKEYLPIVEKCEFYIDWGSLINHYGKNIVVKKIMPKKTRKRLGYHVWFGKIILKY